MIDKSLLDEIIVGRVEPHIYAFTTNTIPNYLKIGDTYRPISVRLKEWKRYFPQLTQQFERKAKVDGDVYFRDYSVHQFIESEKHKVRLQITDIPDDVYYSKEFFKDTTANDVAEAIEDIEKDYLAHTLKYQFYNAATLKALETVFERTETYPLRPNQERTVANFKTAIANGRNNLLMYAVMRFGKSFTSMCCAVEMGAKLVVIVSAKADVMIEWKKTVESHVKFAEYDFVTSKHLSYNNNTITDKLTSGRKVVVFLTLQDLQGDTIKDKHREIFGQNINLLLVDETHFGARAEKYGAVLKQANYEKDVRNKKDYEDFVEIENAEEIIKSLTSDITIHLSGTPYRILMGSEFKKEDIIAFYQFTDIVDDQAAWDEQHILDDDYKEWDNPYYGFPQMIRFAFHPNESSRKKLEELKNSGTTYAFSELFKSLSIRKDDNGLHKKFKYEREIFDLLEVIDGSKDDENLLGFLDYDRIKEGKMCSHVVIVLPYCASCDALEELIKSNRSTFKNLGHYEIINISGVENLNKYRSPEDIKRAIRDCDEKGKKTITLTVNRMLTGSTVPQWDTMLYLKDTASPQEYDQAVFRLQNQYVKTFQNESGDTIKFNMKPQTLLVDFDPNRMFLVQERKSKIYNVNVDTGGNSELERRIKKELQISPIIKLNKDKIERVQATDILLAVSNYQRNKGIKDEALEIPVDLSILQDDDIREIIELENEIGSKSGLSVPAHTGEDDADDQDIEVPGSTEDDTTEETDESSSSSNSDSNQTQDVSYKKKIQSFYTRILLFSFITNDTVKSLSDIITSLETQDNKRIAQHLGLKKSILVKIFEKINKFVLSDLDYKIQDLNGLSKSTDMSPAQRASVAVNKFGKLGDAIVITPTQICNDMVALLPDEFLCDIAANSGRILDIAGTAGEFATSLYQRMSILGIAQEKIANSIYTIPKSTICYELTRKLYELLGLNTSNISEFTSQEILEIKSGKEVDYDKISKLITQNKTFADIKLNDEIPEGKDMIKFDAVVGNPPYQEETKNASENNGQKPRKNIFHHFQIQAQKITNNKTVLILPGKRWIHQSGKGLKQFGKDLINSSHLDKVIFYPFSKDVFDSSDISDGVSIVVTDKNKTSNGFGYIYVTGDKKIELEQNNPGDNLILLNPQDVKIANKISNFVQSNNLKFLKESILSRSLFGIESDFIAQNQHSVRAYKDDDILKANEIKILTNDKAGPAGRSSWFIVDKNTIKQNANFINEWQVVVSSAHPGGQEGRDSQAAIIDDKSAFGRARVALKSFKTEQEAKNFFKYINCTLIKYSFLLSDEALTSLAKFVPDIIDYSNNNQIIDFSKPLKDINNQLYQKCNLSDDEIIFIESMIKPME